MSWTCIPSSLFNGEGEGEGKNKSLQGNIGFNVCCGVVLATAGKHEGVNKY